MGALPYADPRARPRQGTCTSRPLPTASPRGAARSRETSPSTRRGGPPPADLVDVQRVRAAVQHRAGDDRGAGDRRGSLLGGEAAGQGIGRGCAFWRDALGYRHPGPPGVDLPDGTDPLDAWDAFLAGIGVPEDLRNTCSAIEDPDGRGPRVFFQQVPEGKTAKNRVHLDLRAAPGPAGEERMAALETECERLVALGAARVQRYEPAVPLDPGHIVMTDPEGNEFCLD